MHVSQNGELRTICEHWDVCGIHQCFNVVQLKTLEIGVWTYCSKKTLLTHQWYAGGIKSESSYKIACNVLDFWITVKIWIPKAHIPGVSNIEADMHYKVFDYFKQQQLNLKQIEEICEKLVKPNMDLFDKYASWCPKAVAVAVDVFLMTWTTAFTCSCFLFLVNLG